MPEIVTYVTAAALALFSLDTSNKDNREFGTEPNLSAEAGAGVLIEDTLRVEGLITWLSKDRHGNNTPQGARLSADGAAYEVKAAGVYLWPQVRVLDDVCLYAGGGLAIATGDYNGAVVTVGGGATYDVTDHWGVDLGFRWFDASGFDPLGGRVAVTYKF